MKKKILAFFAVIPLATLARAGDLPRVHGWIVPWDQLSSSAPAWGCLDEIGPFAFSFDESHRIVPASGPFLSALLRGNRNPNIPVIPVVVNDVLGKNGRLQTQKSPDLLTELLAAPESISRHVSELLETVPPGDYRGLEIDYEQIPPGLWESFARFVDELGSRLHVRGQTLSVDLEVGPLYKKGQAVASHFWPRLARSSDRVNLMCYYERGDFSDSAGPGNSLVWFKETGRRALSFIPKEKLSLAISLAGTDWTVPLPEDAYRRQVERMHYGQTMQRLADSGAQAAWDDHFSSPYFRYARAGTKHEVWFEDERSLSAKVKAAGELGVPWVSIWYLGKVHPNINGMGLCRGR